MTFISYAQNNEDVMQWRALRDVEKGFYVADEVSELKERLAVSPNILDDFIRYPELAGSQKNALVEQERDSARAHQEALSNALQAAPADGNDELAALPASARPVYQRLKPAVSDGDGWSDGR
jgi:hypothetical protein